MSTASSTPIRDKMSNADTKSNTGNKTFADDRFGRREYADHLNQMIQDISRFKENESFTIALDASWGMGKTQFLHMWQHMLEQPDSPFPSRVVYYNAWENDDCDNALTPLVYQICCGEQKIEDENTLDIMRKLLKTCYLSTIEVASLAFPPLSILKDISKSAIETFAKDKAQNAMEIYQNQMDARKEFRNAIASLAGSGKLIILMDELDRCRPTFAIKTLEAAKHFFNIPNVVFVFAMDMGQLLRSIATIYGQDMDACGYLARFFDVQMQLNHPTAEQYLECVPFCAYPSDIKSMEVLNETVRLFSLSAREILMLLRIFSGFRPFIGLEQNAEYACRFYFLLLTVKYKDPYLYNRILHGDIDALQTSRMNLRNTRTADYLQFAAQYAQTQVNLMDAVMKQTQSDKASNYVQLSLARHFQESAMISEPDDRLFGTVLHEWMELYLAKGNRGNHKRSRSEIIKATRSKLSNKSKPVAQPV